MMVNLFADNAKLRTRAAGIVSSIADVPEAAAKQALETARGNTKLAVLLALGSQPEPALKLLSDYDGNLRPCIAILKAAIQS
jgi:N-acetylmuramic acid 6-phosphate etherase